MGGRTLRLVWCEACCNRHWDLLNGLGEAGRVVSRSGVLKRGFSCGMCRTELAAGEEATALTIDGGPGHVAWEGTYLDLGRERGDERVV